VLDPDDSDPIQAVRRMTDGRGADHVFEATGAAAAMRLGFELTRPGGELTLLGKLGTDDELRLRWGAIAGNKTIRRLAYGGARPERDIPMLAAMHLSDRIDLAPIIDLELPLADIDAGFQAVARGACVRAVAVP
jgi:S-(hydroxymethyl)glutathione dehydrogenase/alcohol dehydrogenase